MTINKARFSIFVTMLFIFFIYNVLPQMSFSMEHVLGKNEIKKTEPQQKENSNPYANAKISTRIIPSINKTFGYEILVNGKTLIHQPNIPALSGNEGFTTKEKAQQVADFVVKKIRKNEMPPTVTINDLNKMGVLKKK